MDHITDENARKGDESLRARVTHQESKSMSTAFESNDAQVRRICKPSFAPYLNAGLQLIPLHRWDAADGKGRPRGKTPRDGEWQKREYDSARVVDAAARDNTNVGVRLPSSVMVLDVDPRNFGDGDSLLSLMIDTGLDLRDVPQTATGSGGAHYWFNKPIEVQLLDSLADYPGVEFKSLGRQVVAAGSVHPNGTAYVWAGDALPDLSSLPDLPSTLLALTRRPVRSHGEAAGFGELTPELLAETLEQLDPCDFKEHEAWLTLMMSCHHATAGEARQEFIDWSTADAQYADDAWIIGRRWDSLHAESGRGGKPITVRYLHKIVHAAGGEVARPDAADDFDAIDEDVPEGTGVDDALLRAEPKAEGIDAVLEEMNSKHYVVLDNGFEIVTEKMDPVLRRVIYQRLSKSDFRSLYDNRQIEQSNRLVNLADVWLKSPHRRQYEGVIFDPEMEHAGWLNLWKGWSVEPKQGNWSLLKELIRDVLVDGDAESYEYVMNWMAYMVQHPGRPAEVTIAFRGDKGTGKGTLGRALADLAGGSGLHISSPEHITGRFNSHLRNCILLFADEAFWAGDKAGESKLKQLVTEPTIAYEAKGRDLATGKNLIHIVMASNSDWVVPAGLGDERRFAVFEVNNKRQGDKPFFGALNAQLKAGGLAGMLHELLIRPIGAWHPRNDIPQNDALTSQKVKTLGQDPLKLWWLDVLESGALPYPLDPEETWGGEEVAIGPKEKTRIVEMVNAKAKQLNRRGDYTKTGVIQVLNKLGINDKYKDKKGVRSWLIPKLDDARAAFNAWLGGDHGWED